MKFTFLGTGTSQGVPVIACDCSVCISTAPEDHRLRSSLLVEAENGWTAVIDTGPDFRQQMLTNHVKRLDAVIFTHHHKDHIAGLDDIRAFNFRQGKPMDIYANSITLEALHREFAYAFVEEKYPGVPSLVLHEIDHAPFSIQSFPIIPIPVMHHRLPVLGFRFGDFAYITDANLIPESSMELLYGVKVLVLNALRKEKHISHFTLDEAIEVIAKIRPEQAYLTHISHLLGKHHDVTPDLPGNVHLAYDRLSFTCS